MQLTHTMILWQIDMIHGLEQVHVETISAFN